MGVTHTKKHRTSEVGLSNSAKIRSLLQNLTPTQIAHPRYHLSLLPVFALNFNAVRGQESAPDSMVPGPQIQREHESGVPTRPCRQVARSWHPRVQTSKISLPANPLPREKSTGPPPPPRSLPRRPPEQHVTGQAFMRTQNSRRRCRRWHQRRRRRRRPNACDGSLRAPRPAAAYRSPPATSDGSQPCQSPVCAAT